MDIHNYSIHNYNRAACSSASYSYTTESLISLSTTYKQCINICSEKLLVCEGFIVVKIAVSFPPAKISRGGVGNICKYLDKQGFDFFFQTFKPKLHQEVPVCIRYL